MEGGGVGLMKLSFPDGASEQEIRVFESLPCLGSISDEDFDYRDEVEPKSDLNYCVRALLIDGDKICVEDSKKYGYIQILGGHIEGGESIEMAARRETIEEGGYEADELTPLGYFFEDGVAKKHISFVYLAKPGKFVGTAYEEDEIECEFEPVWYDVNEAVRMLEDADKEYIESYNGRFANKRDLLLLKEFLRRKNED